MGSRCQGDGVFDTAKMFKCQQSRPPDIFLPNRRYYRNIVEVYLKSIRQDNIRR